MTKRSVILYGGAVLLVLLGAFFLLYSSLDSIVKKAIEHYGSEATGTWVQVDSVSISASDGRGALRGVRVGNPEGFSSGEAFRFEEVILQLDVGTLRDSPVVVEEILILGPVVNYELKLGGSSNIDVIRKNVRDRRSGQRPSRGGEPTRLLIREFALQEGRVQVQVRGLAGKEFALDLPAVRLSNVGGPEGATASDIARTLLLEITQKTTRALPRGGLERYVREKLGQEGGQAAQDLLRSLIQR